MTRYSAGLVAALVACCGDATHSGRILEPPVAVIDATPDAGRPPLLVRFDGSRSTASIGGVVAWSWQFGDGGTGVGPEVLHTYRAVGRYEVTLTVTDGRGNVGMGAMTVTATSSGERSPPTAKLTVAPSAGEAPLRVVFDARDSSDPDGRIVLHIVETGDGRRLTGPMVEHTYEDVGRYEATLTVVDDHGSSDETTVTVRATEEGGAVPPQARMSLSPGAGFAPLNVDFDGSNSEAREGTITTHGWTFGDGQMGTGAMTSHVFSGAGVFFPRLTVTNSGGATDEASRRLVVRGPSPIPFGDDYATDRGWVVHDHTNGSGPSQWALDGGRLVQRSNVNDGTNDESPFEKLGTIVHYGDPSWTDYVVRVTAVSPDDDGIGVLARVADADNYYRFSVDRQRTYARLAVSVAGELTLLAEDLDHPGYVSEQAFELALRVVGDRIEGLIDGAVVLATTDGRLAAGAVGLYSWASEDLAFDDLTVTSTTVP